MTGRRRQETGRRFRVAAPPWPNPSRRCCSRSSWQVRPGPGALARYHFRRPAPGSPPAPRPASAPMLPRRTHHGRPGISVTCRFRAGAPARTCLSNLSKFVSLLFWAPRRSLGAAGPLRAGAPRPGRGGRLGPAGGDVSLSGRLICIVVLELNKNAVEGFSAGLIDDNDIYKWEVLIIGPPDTL